MKRRNRTSILILLVLACLVLLGTGTYAAYTNVKSIKRVVAVKGATDELRFSSNYLLPYDPNDTVFSTKLISAGETESASISLTICNYPQNDVTKYSDSNIPYTLSVQVFDSENIDVMDSNILSNILIEGNALKGSYPGTLTGGKQSTDVYHITFDVNEISKYTVQIKAVPDASTGIGKILAANFKVVAASKLSTGWTGRFVESGKSLADLDAFNYEISGSAQGRLTLTWDSTIELSRWSKEALDIDPDAERNSITFSVGGDGQPGSYQLQFYRVKGYSEGDVWPTVSYVFTEAP